MKSSTSFVVVLLSLSAMACAGSGAHTRPARLSGPSAGEGLGSLWIPSEGTRSGEDIEVAYHRKAHSDLWMQPEIAPNTQNGPREPRPRLDSVLSRLTPRTSFDVLRASHPVRAQQ